MVEKQRVQKLLSNYGYCSRRKAEDLIDQGQVKVNGEVITLGDKATVDDEITVNGKIIKGERKVYLVFNKPPGCVTAVTDDHDKTIMDYIKVKERVFPVGRLDKNSTGILLLTNDGDFANKIMHPSFEVTKTYEAQIDHSFNERDRRALERGILLDDGKTAPAKVKVLAPDLVSIKIHEGKNRIIRRMLKKLGYKTFYLHRAKIGKLGIGDLRPGKFRHLTPKDKEIIFVK
jgi:23S rRNA pseudouridine2605 synthase